MSSAVVCGGHSAVVSDRPLRWVCWALHVVDTDHSGRWGDLSLEPWAVRAALGILADAPQVGVPSPKHLPVVLGVSGADDEEVLL